jgi:hypothetical protein
MTPQETARAILALYDGKPERWAQNTEARAADGEEVVPRDPRAVCWCIYGAAEKVLGARGFNSPFDMAMNRITGTDEWPIDWNDAPERMFADVVALLERIAAEPEATP